MTSFVIYWLSFFISATFAWLVQDKIPSRPISLWKESCYILFITALPLMVLIFRVGIGVDYENYVWLFTKFENKSFSDFFTGSFFWGFEFLNYLIAKTGFFFSGSVQGVFALYAFLTFFIFGKTIFFYRNSINMPMAFLVLYAVYFTASMNIVRQLLAVALFVFSLKYLIAGKILPYIVIVLIASFIHSTAIIFLPLSFWGFKKNTVYMYYIHILIIIIIVVLPFFINEIVANIINLELLPRYFENYDVVDRDIWAAYVLRIPIYLPLFLFFREIAKGKDDVGLYFALILLDLSLLSVAHIYQWGFRFSYYTFVAQVLLISLLIKRLRRSNKIMMATYYVTYYVGQFYVFYFLWGRDGIFPYSSWLL